MRTVGQVLKEEREKKFYSLDDIEKATKIRKELLNALEADDYLKLPPPTFIQGFIKNYGKFLGLDTVKLLAIFRREFSERQNPPRVIDALANPLTNPKFALTPQRVLSVIIVTLVAVFFIYLWWQYRNLVAAPNLEVAEPSDQLSAASAAIKVTGKTDPEAQMTINNQPVILDANGGFSQEIKLNEGANKIVITATSKFGQTTRVERTIFLRL